MTLGVKEPMQLHIFVSGRVQGVGFREFARRSAEKTGVCGYAKNLVNGDVEVAAEGTRAALDEFLLLLEQGPPASNVDDVRIDELKGSRNYTGFEIRY